jgi:hypothetical protein
MGIKGMTLSLMIIMMMMMMMNVSSEQKIAYFVIAFEVL